VPVPGLNTASNDEGLSLSPDGLVAYFSSDRPGGAGGFDIWMATRASTSDAFGSIVAVGGVNSASNEREPRISRDGLRLFFSSDQVTTNGSDIVVATRATALATFGTAAALANINSTSAEYEAFLTGDEQTIYFESNRTGGLGSFDLYMATVGAGGNFGTPQNVAALNSAGSDTSAVLTPDGLTVYFASTRSAATMYDVYVAHRSTLNDGFGTPAAVAELNSDSFDWPMELSADGCTIYIGTNRTGGMGAYDIYSARRGQ
jgi:Tol biopolymer transport system component